MSTENFYDAVSPALIEGLHAGRSPSKQIAALDQIYHSPNGVMYSDEVFLLASSTCRKEVYDVAMTCLRGIAFDLYARVQVKYPWGERRGSRRVWEPTNINAV